jgi:urease accessory protein
LGLTRERAVRVYLFMAMRGVVSAAVRLGTVGPMQAQEIQAGMAGELEALAAEALAWGVDDAVQVAPLLELWQGGQDRLYSRLFQS